MNAQKPKPILIVDVSRTGLRACVPGQNDPVDVTFPPGLLLDMEVINTNGLMQVLHAFFSEKKISGYQVVLIFGESLYFEIDLSGLPITEQEIQFNSFVESVPMEAVMARRLAINEKVNIGAAVNRNTYEFFKNVFSLAGMDVVAAVPASAAKVLGYEEQLSAKSCVLLYKKIKQLREFSFLHEPDMAATFATSQRKVIGNHQVIFGVVSLAAVVVALITSVVTLRRPTPRPKVIQAAGSTLSVTPKVAPQNLHITIQSATTSAVVVDQVRADFLSSGFESISLTTSSSSATTKLGFSSRVGEGEQETVKNIVLRVAPTFDTVDVPDSDTDIFIVLGNETKITP